jgi:CheY-specific phosphatase CheX
MLASLNAQCVINANTQFWEQMLAMTVDPKPMPGGFTEGPGDVLSSVTLSGKWRGRVEVRLASGLARQATAAMLMQPAAEVSESDTLDATKEIANMIAGVIKSSLPRPCSMTVPQSTVAGEDVPNARASDDALTVVFHHAVGDLRVRVIEDECAVQECAAHAFGTAGRVGREQGDLQQCWVEAACAV